MIRVDKFTFIVILILITGITKIFSQKKMIDDELLKKVVSVLPHERQYNWQKNEFTAFIHFGVNTFSEREWGTGLEDPKIFNPANLNTDQWCEAIKSAGMKMIVFTAKHHDGFCLWQTRYTKHSVSSSEWKNGNGDVLKELSKSCKKYGLKLGVYLSPADLYQIESPEGLYGNKSQYSLRTIPRKIAGREFEDKRTFQFNVDDYNEYFLNQLFELLTEYGPIDEVWFDGAHPKRKGNQQYAYHDWFKLIRKLAPEAVIFGKGPDVRWCGNEAGSTRKSEWSVIPIEGKRENWVWNDMVEDDLGSLNKIKNVMGNGGFLHWYPAETNTSIRHGWFWRDENQYVKTTNEILDIWFRSVGGNSVFLLNIPPNSDGLISERDVKVLQEVGQKITETFENNLSVDAKIKASSYKSQKYKPKNILDQNLDKCWMPKEDDKSPNVEISLSEKQKFNVIALQEQIQNYSQRISEFKIEAQINNKWKTIAQGTTVGYKKICRIPIVTSQKLKLTILDSRLSPTINNFALYYEERTLDAPVIKRSKDGFVEIHSQSNGEIKFTTDGTEPNKNSKTYSQKFSFKKSGIIKAILFNDNLQSEVATKNFDISKNKWKILDASGAKETAKNLIDEDENTNWFSNDVKKFISIDLGEELLIKGFTYTPNKKNLEGTIEKYEFYASDNGKDWKSIKQASFDNIRNNPVKQFIHFENEISATFIKLISLKEINNNDFISASEIGILTQ
ncbi:MAG: alpha-1,3/4-fucosidase [Ignavibacteriae bacterium]|nr:MAG: alpha-1,3/4-fucosidase [Ignavibacteriota bacterium]